jgi:recombinational DNA repair protein (RecF pathway)
MKSKQDADLLRDILDQIKRLVNNLEVQKVMTETLSGDTDTSCSECGKDLEPNKLYDEGEEYICSSCSAQQWQKQWQESIEIISEKNKEIERLEKDNKQLRYFLDNMQNERNAKAWEEYRKNPNFY